MLEIIKGEIVAISPVSSLKHHRVSGNMYADFNHYIRRRKSEAFYAPFDVRFLTNKQGKTNKDIYTVVQPDICVICDKAKLDEKGCIGAPDLIVEIVSKDSWKTDVWIKKDLYEEHGVKEYWLVCPNDNLVEVFTLGELGLYGKPQVYTDADTIIPSMFPDFYLSLANVFMEL